jgi:predicted porin
LVFSVSEDLGNGMSAFAKIHNYRDNAAPSAGGYADQIVGVKGDFGTVVVGRMEDFTEGKVSAMANAGFTDALSIEPNRTYKTGRAEGGMAYVSPSFNGLTFGVAGFALDNGGSAASTTTGSISVTAIAGVSGSATTDVVAVSSGTATLTTETDTAANVSDATAKLDATNIFVEYANGPLLVRASHEVKNKETFNESNATDQKITNIGVNYTMGDVKLIGYMYETENGGGVTTNDVDGYMVGAQMNMGNNKLSIGYTEEDSLNSSGDKQNGQDETWAVSFSHSLSKRTSINATYNSHDDVTATNDKDQFGIGLKHTF